MGYQIYQLRTPEEQVEADPTKKTLVILGIYRSIGILDVLVDCFQVRGGDPFHYLKSLILRYGPYGWTVSRGSVN